MGRITVAVQNQQAAASHVDVRRVVPVTANNHIPLPDLAPLVTGSSGQQGGHRRPLVHHEPRRIQTVGGVAPVTQHVITVERNRTRPGIHGALEHDRAAGTVKNQIGTGAYLGVRGPRSLRGGISAHPGSQACVIRADVSLNEGTVSIGIRYVPQHVPAAFRHADGKVETVHVIAGPLVAGTHLAESSITGTAAGLAGPHPFPLAGILIEHVGGASAVARQHPGRQRVGLRRPLEIVPETVGGISLGVLRIRVSRSGYAGLSLKYDRSPGQVGISACNPLFLAVADSHGLGSGTGAQH